MNEVLLGTTLGIVLGPHVGKIFDPRDWSAHSSNAVTLEVMRVVLATGLFAIGVELPKSYLLDHVRGLLVMVLPTMAFGWAVIASTPFARSTSTDASFLIPGTQQSSIFYSPT
jgi:NhaP-type Na+/H+ or K+/H+ antiporter